MTFDPTQNRVPTCLLTAGLGLKRIIEEIDGAMNHGTWRDERGMRLQACLIAAGTDFMMIAQGVEG